MKRNHQQLFNMLVAVISMSQVQTVVADVENEDWQLRRLMQPTQDEQLREETGHIMIYEGLTDRQVAVAMDRHFTRIQSMMFTGIVITDADGAPQIDSTTGELLTEDDGCD